MTKEVPVPVERIVEKFTEVPGRPFESLLSRDFAQRCFRVLRFEGVLHSGASGDKRGSGAV